MTETEPADSPRRLRGRPGDAASFEGDERAVHIGTLQREASERFRQPRSKWWRTWSWLVLLVLAVVAFVLAVVGSDPPWHHRVADALHLFPSGFPGRPAPGEPGTFTAARYLAAVVSLSVTLGVVLAVFARGFVRYRAATRRDHVVVCGLGEKGIRSARAFRHRGAKVTCIDLDASSDAAGDMRARGALVLEGDATQRNLLSTARAGRAAHVVCACHDDADNARIAAQVAQLAQETRGRRVTVHVHIANPELSSLLRPPALRLESVRVEFFNIYDLWADALVDQARMYERARLGGTPTVVVIGSTALARAVVVGVARRWRNAVGADGRRIRLAIVAPDASALCASVAARYVALERAVRLVPVDHALSASSPPDVGPVLDGDEDAVVYLCLYDDAENLSLALQVRQHLPRGSRVLVPATAWTGDLAPLLLDPASGIHAVGYSDRPDALDVLRDSARERMARAAHAAYRASPEAREGASLPWPDLPEELRESNRRQVDAMVRHLGAIWYAPEPLYDWDAPLCALSSSEADALAELEHRRWCEEKLAEGYRLGDETSDREQTHRDLVPWSDLDGATRNKDREAVAAWPRMLASVGFTLRRSPMREHVAQLIHEHHLRRRLSDDASASEATDVPWDRLTEAQRELSRASADDIALKLARIGCRVGWAEGTSARFSFAPAELEMLAEHEHERWLRERQSAGWRVGPKRDDAARIHPGLVPWDELSESWREVDREHVRAIPEVLREVGLGILGGADGDGQRGV